MGIPPGNAHYKQKSTFLREIHSIPTTCGNTLQDEIEAKTKMTQCYEVPPLNQDVLDGHIAGSLFKL